MTQRQKYLIYQAYHEYKHGRVFNMDLATALFGEGFDPSVLEDLFDEGLRPIDITGDDENDETSTYQTEDEEAIQSEITWKDEGEDLFGIEPQQLMYVSDALTGLYNEIGEEEATTVGMVLTFVDGTQYSFESLTLDVIEDIKLIEQRIEEKEKNNG